LADMAVRSNLAKNLGLGWDRFLVLSVDISNQIIWNIKPKMPFIYLHSTS